jgi:CBS domain-containing protein
VTAEEDTPLAQIAQLFERHNIKRVPIVRQGKMVGIVSRADLLRVLADLHEQSGPVETDDVAIRTELLKRLKAEHWFSASQIEISVNGGIVKVEGIAGSPEQQTAIRVAAENVPGVRTVNDVTVLRKLVGE